MIESYWDLGVMGSLVFWKTGCDGELLRPGRVKQLLRAGCD